MMAHSPNGHDYITRFMRRHNDQCGNQTENKKEKKNKFKIIHSMHGNQTELQTEKNWSKEMNTKNKITVWRRKQKSLSSSNPSRWIFNMNVCQLYSAALQAISV